MLEIYPTNLEALKKIAHIHKTNEDMPKAIEFYNKYLENNPYDYDV
jgi:hypothetical protein